MGAAVELSDVHHIVLILEHSSLERKTFYRAEDEAEESTLLLYTSR